MKNEKSQRKRLFLFRKPDLTLAVLGVLAGAAEIVVSNAFHLNRAYFGYTILAACLFYLFTYRVFGAVQTAAPMQDSQRSTATFLLFSGLSLVFLLASTFLLRASHSYVRGMDYVGSLFWGSGVYRAANCVLRHLAGVEAADDPVPGLAAGDWVQGQRIFPVSDLDGE